MRMGEPGVRRRLGALVCAVGVMWILGRGLVLVARREVGGRIADGERRMLDTKCPVVHPCAHPLCPWVCGLPTGLPAGRPR